MLVVLGIVLRNKSNKVREEEWDRRKQLGCATTQQRPQLIRCEAYLPEAPSDKSQRLHSHQTADECGKPLLGEWVKILEWNSSLKRKAISGDVLGSKLL